MCCVYGIGGCLCVCVVWGLYMLGCDMCLVVCVVCFMCGMLCGVRCVCVCDGV